MSDADPKLCFVDTDVWLYAFIKTQDQNKTALAKATIRGCDVVISSQVVNEVCVNLIKKAGFDETRIRNLIESFYSKYRVAVISQPILVRASELREKYNFSYWDSLIIACALAEGATVIYSEDMHSGLTVENSLRIVNPFTQPNPDSST